MLPPSKVLCSTVSEFEKPTSSIHSFGVVAQTQIHAPSLRFLSVIMPAGSRM